MSPFLKEGQIRIEYKTVQGPFLITQLYQSFSHNCHFLRDLNRFNIVFLPVVKSRKTYNFLQAPLASSLSPSQPILEQGSQAPSDDPDEEEKQDCSPPPLLTEEELEEDEDPAISDQDDVDSETEDGYDTDNGAAETTYGQMREQVKQAL